MIKKLYEEMSEMKQMLQDFYEGVDRTKIGLKRLPKQPR